MEKHTNIDLIPYSDELNLNFNALECLVKEMPTFAFQGQTLKDYLIKINTYGMLYFVLEGNVPLALIGFYANNVETKTAYLSCIAVSQKLQGQGIGQYLFSKMCTIAQEKGMQKLQLNVLKDNTQAIRFYEKNDATIVGVGQDETYWLMEKILLKTSSN